MHIRKLLLREMKQLAQGHPTSKWQVVVGLKPCPCLHTSLPPLRWLVIVEVVPGARARKQASPSAWRMWGERAEGAPVLPRSPPHLAGGSGHLGQASQGAAGCCLSTLGIKALAGLTGELPTPHQPLLPRRGCGPHITGLGPGSGLCPGSPNWPVNPHSGPEGQGKALPRGPGRGGGQQEVLMRER